MSLTKRLIETFEEEKQKDFSWDKKSMCEYELWLEEHYKEVSLKELENECAD